MQPVQVDVVPGVDDDGESLGRHHSDQPAQAAPPPPAPAAVQPAPAASPSSAVSQPTPSNVTVLPASPKVTPAPPVKNAKRDDARDLLDQVPPGLRKRFGF